MPITASRIRPAMLATLLLAGLTGCSSMPAVWQVEAKPEAAAAPPPMPDAQVLAVLDEVVAGTPRVLPDGIRVLADQTYAAASGYDCRGVQLSYPDGRVNRRLACAMDGRWRWVPAVTPGYTN